MRRLRIPLAAVACIISSIASLMLPTACGTAVHDGTDSSYSSIISDTISEIVASYPGEIGVAVIIDDSDTVAVNNRNIYPMMSVFKVHQALALCDDFDRRGISLDTLITIRRDELDPHTWSPMMKDYPDSEFSLTVKDLLRYTLRQSDNNASNLMFGRLLGVEKTDSFISTVIPRRDFRIAYTEAEMSADHRRAYSNSTSPLGAAELINRLFTDSLVSRDKQDFIMRTLGECETGKDRIAAPLLDREGVSIAHKTGSGYTNEEGVLAAHNDVAYICLPNGTRYSLAVFVKDFKGNETHAAKAIAHVSAAVYSILSKD